MYNPRKNIYLVAVPKMEILSRIICCIIIPLFFQPLNVYCQAQQPSSNSPATECTRTPLAKSGNNFGSSLIKAIGGENNLFISPLSIYNALAMTYVAAQGKTSEQMEDALKLADSGLDKSKLNEAFQNYLTTIEAGNDQYSLLLANGMFLQQDYAVKDEYVADLQKYYRAVVKNKDFVNDGKKATEEINEYVATNTKEKIQKLFQEPLESDTVLVLINAIYFKGTWKIEFPKDKTTDGTFNKNDGSTKIVKFMTLAKQKFRYFYDSDSNYKFLELPYKGGDISMVLALPEDQKQSPDLDMTADFLCKVNGSLTETELETVVIPKFQIRYRKNLVEILQKLGVNDVFTNSADLSGISGKKNLKVSVVLHEAVIEVNEEGSEAAATTAVVITKYALNLDRFVASHPFLFYIVDMRNGFVLFSGRVSDP